MSSVKRVGARARANARETLFRFTLGMGNSSLAPDAYAPSPGPSCAPCPTRSPPACRGYRYVVASNRVLLVGTSRIVVGVFADANAR